MFASAAQRNTQTHLSSAYRDVSVETGVSSASPHQLVLMLYDGFLESVTQARGAIATRNIETKCRAIVRALRIVDEGLNAGLNLEEGGQLAQDLHQLYNYVALRLAHANLHNDASALEECARLVEPLRAGWIAIASAQATTTQ
jgi:flagellar protein FliS